MAVHVVLDVFSGRENPKWTLSNREADELGRWLRATRTLSTRKPPGLFGYLGYRGFRLSISRKGAREELYISGGVIDRGAHAPSLNTRSAELEQWLMSTAPRGLVPQPVMEEFESRVKQFVSRQEPKLQAGNGCHECVAFDAPDYEPHLWNVLPQQMENNCYNYANDNATETFAQPGRGSGQIFDALTCANVGAAAVRDGLRHAANFATPLAQNEGWYVALAIWPGTDYHWWRQDRNGCWSHKPGETPVINTGADGNPIVDPQAPATRGTYVTWCGYMIADFNTTID